MLVDSLITNLSKGQSTNSTASAFSVNDTKATTTEPAASATRTVINWTGSSMKSRNTLRVVPYGGNDNNDIFNVKVMGWNRITPPTLKDVPIFISQCICIVQCTVSNALLGLASQAVVATEFFCDTIALTSGVAAVYTGTADIDTAWFLCDVGPFEYVEILGDLDTGGDTMNWLLGF